MVSSPTATLNEISFPFTLPSVMGISPISLATVPVNLSPSTLNVKVSDISSPCECLTMRTDKMMSSGDSNKLPLSVGDAVDMTVLASLEEAQAEGEPDLVVDLIDLYLEDAPRRLAAMSATLAERDALSLRREAHGLKGSSATLGAGPSARLCEAVEQIAQDSSPKAIAMVLNGLEQEFARVREAFLIERQRRTSAGSE